MPGIGIAIAIGFGFDSDTDCDPATDSDTEVLGEPVCNPGIAVPVVEGSFSRGSLGDPSSSHPHSGWQLTPKALMSIGAVKGVEIGAGFDASRMLGSENNDPITPEGFASNNAGGILAGISNGDVILIRAAIKPIPSISITQKTVDVSGRARSVAVKGRHIDMSLVERHQAFFDLNVH